MLHSNQEYLLAWRNLSSGEDKERVLRVSLPLLRWPVTGLESESHLLSCPTAHLSVGYYKTRGPLAVVCWHLPYILNLFQQYFVSETFLWLTPGFPLDVSSLYPLVVTYSSYYEPEVR